MSSEITNFASASAGMAAPRTTGQTPPINSPLAQVTETPKVQAPKPVAIHFDPAEIRQDLQEAVSMLNQQVNANNRGLGFHVDESVGGPVVTVRSSETGEVVRQIPNEVIVKIAHTIDHVKGLLFSAKA